MQSVDNIHLLMQFGLTHLEAQIYTCLHGRPEATGYELAKLTGISRSNTYAGLSSLVEKGGARLIEGKPTLYSAVPVGEFCGNVIRTLGKVQSALESRLSLTEEDDSAYLTIKGGKNITDKIETLIEQTRYRVYISMTAGLLQPFIPELEQLADQGRKVVVITDDPLVLRGCTVYLSDSKIDESIRLISDTRTALTGSLRDNPGCTCLYSTKENLVSLLRDSMKNEIRLIELTGGTNI